MKALAVRPRERGSLHLAEVPPPEPRDGQVRVRVLEAGVCGTDAEINDGLYGEAPAGEGLLVLGHEALGRREDDGTLVVPMVRRPCPECRHCRAGMQDLCESDRFTERGIKGVHGAFCEAIAEHPSLLVPVPEAARPYAVLLEPMSVVAKGLRHALLIQRRLRWEPRSALVLGAGPIGLLATLTLRLLGWEVTTVARKPPGSPKAAVAAAAGARYHSVADAPLGELRPGFDFILEATGSAEAAFESMSLLAANGALCLTSVTGGGRTAAVPVDRLNCELVLGNKLVFGTVNAAREDFVSGLDYLRRIEAAFPGQLARLITARLPFAEAARLLDVHREGIKTVLVLAP